MIHAQRLLPVALALLAVAVASSCGSDASSDAGGPAGKGSADRSPNIVIWMVDTLRADRLSSYGYERPTSPHFDALAADGVLFEQCHVHSNWTQPSVSSILSGRYPVTYGGDFVNAVPDELLMGAEWLSEQGYATVGFTVSVAVGREFGFDQGYDLYEELDTDFDGQQRKQRLGSAWDADVVVDRAVRWLDTERDADRPFFLYLHTIDPHLPHQVHEGHASWNEPYSGPLDGTTTTTFEAQDQAWPLTEADHRYMTDLYDGEVAFNDAEFGRLRAALTERGLDSDTLIVVISDHGEEFWDRTMYGHGHDNLHAEMTHVPLIMAWPGKLPAGKRVDGRMLAVDILPTLLQLSGLPALPSAEGRSVLGPVLERGTLSGEAGQSAPLFVMRARQHKDPRAVRTDDFFYFEHPRKERAELYQLTDDPGARVDVAARYPGLTRRAAGLLAEFVASMRATEERLGPRSASEPDAETVERLRQLGYLR